MTLYEQHANLGASCTCWSAERPSPQLLHHFNPLLGRKVSQSLEVPLQGTPYGMRLLTSSFHFPPELVVHPVKLKQLEGQQCA